MKGTIIGILSAAIWGFAFVVMKRLAGTFSSYEMAFYRYLIATIAFYVVVIKNKGRMLPKKKDVLKVFISSMFGIGIYSVLVVTSMKWLSTSIVGMLNGTIPLITLIISRFWFKNKLSKKMIAALFISLGGILLMSMPLGAGKVIGYGVMIFAMFLWVIYSFLTNELIEEYKDVELMGYYSLFSCVVLLPIIIKGYGMASVVKLMDIQNFIWMMLLGVVVTALAYLFYIKGNKMIGVSKMSLIMNLIPVVSLMAGYVFYNEPLSIQKVAGLGLIMLSIVMISKKGKGKKQVKIEETESMYKMDA